MNKPIVLMKGLRPYSIFFPKEFYDGLPAELKALFLEMSSNEKPLVDANGYTFIIENSEIYEAITSLFPDMQKTEEKELVDAPEITVMDKHEKKNRINKLLDEYNTAEPGRKEIIERQLRELKSSLNVEENVQNPKTASDMRGEGVKFGPNPEEVNYFKEMADAAEEILKLEDSKLTDDDKEILKEALPDLREHLNPLSSTYVPESKLRDHAKKIEEILQKLD